MAHKVIYLDHAATTPVHPEVMPVMLPFFGYHYGNPHSIHSLGSKPRQALEEARAQVAALIGAQPSEIVFTSGGTEADNLAIQGIARARRGGHIITSAVEHHAVLNTCAFLETQGFAVSYLGVDGKGRVDPGAVAKAIREDTILISIMHANNEVGTIQTLEAIGRIARERGVPFHTDAVQSAGKIPIDVEALRIDLLSLASHKLYGPKGVGALYVRTGVDIAPLVYGGGHEGGLRSGTEDIAGIIGFGRACMVAQRDLGANMLRVKDLRDCLEHMIGERIPGIRINGDSQMRLPHTLSVTFEGLEAESIVIALDAAGICASAGAACTSTAVTPSHVLTAMGLQTHLAFATVRFSLGWENTETEIERTVDALAGIVTRQRAFHAGGHHDMGVLTFPEDAMAVRAEALLATAGLPCLLGVTPGHLRGGVSLRAVHCPWAEAEKAVRMLEEKGLTGARLNRIHGISKPVHGLAMERKEQSFWETMPGPKDKE